MERNDKVVVLSESVCASSGLPYSPGVTVYIHDEPYTVIGVVRENPSLTLSYGSVYLPLGAKPGADEEEAQPAAGGGAAAAQTGKRSTQIVVSTLPVPQTRLRRKHRTRSRRNVPPCIA